MFERALAAQEKFLGPNHPEVGAAAANLADVLSRSGEDDLARRHYERALYIWEQSLGVKHPKVATGLVNLARFHSRTGSDENAAPLLARALAIQQEALGPEHPDLVLTLRSRAELMARADDRVEAFALAARAAGIAREHLRLTVRTLPERQALAYAASFGAELDLMLHLASSEPSGSALLTGTWDAVIRARGIVLDEVGARHRSATAGDTSDGVERAAALTAARQRLAALAVRGIRNDPPERYRRLLEEAKPRRRARSVRSRSTAAGFETTNREPAFPWTRCRRPCHPTARWWVSSGITRRSRPLALAAHPRAKPSRRIWLSS